ncbi:hypothetical protein [Shewanella colwelliana]|uniref:hypothetical protein n=1 Tax=Shewanella colwelliana TaxID=23 RepID=UPI001C7CC9A0|nr:hypothetical protein [Shewanella colwelliana]
MKVEPSWQFIACPAGDVQILLRDAVRHPWPLNENIHVFDTLCRIYTGLLTFFDLTSFDTVHEVLADI